MALLNNQAVRILNLLSTKFSTDENVYSINVDKSEIKIQTTYSASLVAFLVRKKFVNSISTSGFLYLQKTIGNVNIRFVFTD